MAVTVGGGAKGGEDGNAGAREGWTRRRRSERRRRRRGRSRERRGVHGARLHRDETARVRVCGSAVPSRAGGGGRKTRPASSPAFLRRVLATSAQPPMRIRGRFRWLSRTTLAARRIRDVERRLHHRQRGGIPRRATRRERRPLRRRRARPAASVPSSAAALTRVAAAVPPPRTSRAWCERPRARRDQRAGARVSRDDAFVEGVDGVRPGRASRVRPGPVGDAPEKPHGGGSLAVLGARPPRVGLRAGARVHPLQGDAQGVLRVRRQGQDLPRTAEGGARGGDREAPD